MNLPIFEVITVWMKTFSNCFISYQSITAFSKAHKVKKPLSSGCVKNWIIVNLHFQCTLKQLQLQTCTPITYSKSHLTSSQTTEIVKLSRLSFQVPPRLTSLTDFWCDHFTAFYILLLLAACLQYLCWQLKGIMAGRWVHHTLVIFINWFLTRVHK